MTNKRTVYGKKLLTASVLVSMLPGGLAFAEEALPLYTLDAVVVTATRTDHHELGYQEERCDEFAGCDHRLCEYHHDEKGAWRRS